MSLVKILVALGMGWSMVSLVQAAPFTDVAQGHPHYDALVYLKEYDVLEGYADGSFRPNQVVNRAEALKMITLASGMATDTEGDVSFPDVELGSWYLPFVSAALSEGIIQGYPDGSFRPGTTVNRVEAMKMTYHAFFINVEEVEVASSPFADVPVNDATRWFLPYVEYAKRSNTVEPVTLQQFRPADGMTRGDIAEMIYRVLYIQEHKKERFTTGYSGGISYYADMFEGRGTAYGETFRQDRFTAANMEYDHGTFIQVVDHRSNRSVVVKVNDRGPFSEGRIVDLSRIAFTALGPISRGVSTGEVRRLFVDPGLDKWLHAKTVFTGITLDAQLPNIMQEEETYVLSGMVSGTHEVVTAWYPTSNGTQRFTAQVQEGRFILPVTFGKSGRVQLTVIAGESGTGAVADIRVIAPVLGTMEVADTTAPSGLQVRHDTVLDRLVFQWNDPANRVFRIVWYQGDRRVERLVTNGTRYVANPTDFSTFTEGPVSWYVEGAKSSTRFSHDRYTLWRASDTSEFVATVRHRRFVEEGVTLTRQERSDAHGTLVVEGRSALALAPKAFVTLPNGTVQEVTLSGTMALSNGAFPAGSGFALSVPITAPGTYVVEINEPSGEPLVILPFYGGVRHPLLPGRFDGERPVSGSLPGAMIDWINEDRILQGLGTVRADQALMDMARDRAQDMVDREYFSHVTPEGNTVQALRLSYGIRSSLSENIAYDSSLFAAYGGLMESPGHRRNILDATASRVGIGVVEEDGVFMVVQLFGEQEVEAAYVATWRTTLVDNLNTTGTGVTLVQDKRLNDVATAWSALMVEEQFFDVKHEGTSLVSVLGEQSFPKAVKVYIFTATNIQMLEEKIRETTNLTNGIHTHIGLGVEQGKDGLIKAVVLYY